MAGQYRFKDINGNVVAQISSSADGTISFSGSAVDFSNASTITLGQVQLAGTASNALLLDGFDSTAFVFTSSFNTISQSISSQLNTLQTTSGSNIGRLNNLESKSSSVDISISNINTVTESVLSRTSNLESKSSSVDISISNINSFTASNGNESLNSKTGSYATTGSNTFFGTQTYSGSVYIANDLIVQGSSSIQYISASSVSIGTNIVQLNTANPSVRFAGLTIIDSGSVGGSGSFLYDSVHDEFVFVHRGNGTNVTSSHFVLGPETYDSLGNETYLTTNILSKGTGKEHLIDSCIFDNGTTTCIKNNLVGTGTACFGGRICSPSITTDVVSTIGSSFVSPSTAGLGYGIFGYSGVGLGISAAATGPNQGIGFFTCGDFERVRIVSNGNVGVGTNCPVRKIDIVATGEQLRLAYDTSGTVYTDFRNDSAGGLLINTSGPYIVNYINGSAKMRIDADAICFSTTICSPTIISSGTICSISNTCFGGNTIINGCVGMGTATPTAKLHVYCNSDVWHIKIGSACGELRIGGETASGAVIQSYTPAGVVRDLYIQRDGGNIGIGTNCALSKVHIYASCAGGAAAPNSNTLLLIDSNNHQLIEMRTCNAAYGAMQGIVFTDNGLNAFVGYKEYTCQTAGTYGEALHLAFTDYSATDPNNGIYFGTSSTPNCGVSKPLMFIKGNGCIGIGTCTPESTLHINGTSSGGYGASLTLTNVGTAANTATGIDFGVDASTAGGGSGNAQIKVVNIGGSSGANCSDMIFSLWNGATFNERLRLISNGNVCIPGNLGLGLVPGSKLSVNGNISLGTSANYNFAGPSQYGGITLPRAEIFFSNTNSQNQFYLASNAYNNVNGVFAYRNNGCAVSIGLDNGGISFLTGPNGTADVAVNWATPLSIANAGTVTIGGGNLVNSSNNKSHTFCQLTSAITKTFTTTGGTTGNFPVTDFSGIPSNAKALQVYGWYHITGYAQGNGQGDHAVTWFGINNDTSPYPYSTPGAAWPGSNTTFSAASYGSFAMEHDGDASLGSSSINYYGSWHNGIITVNSSGNVLYALAQGLSGGTHYIALYVTGYWL
jgi:hypothetical protein